MEKSSRPALAAYAGLLFLAQRTKWGDETFQLTGTTLPKSLHRLMPRYERRGGAWQVTVVEVLGQTDSYSLYRNAVSYVGEGGSGVTNSDDAVPSSLPTVG